MGNLIHMGTYGENYKSHYDALYKGLLRQNKKPQVKRFQNKKPPTKEGFSLFDKPHVPFFIVFVAKQILTNH